MSLKLKKSKPAGVSAACDVPAAKLAAPRAAAAPAPAAADDSDDGEGMSLFAPSVKKKAARKQKVDAAATAVGSVASPDVIAAAGTPATGTAGIAWNTQSFNPRATFADLGLAPWQTRVLTSLAITKPTEIQQRCIPAVLAGHDVVGRAKTGSGKTAAFALPILHTLSQDPFGICALVLTPTRELAYQIADQFRALGAPMNLHAAVVIGGMGTCTPACLLQTRTSRSLSSCVNSLSHVSLMSTCPPQRSPRSAPRWSAARTWLSRPLAAWRSCCHSAPG
jgi:hypothetical protein